MKRFPRQSGMAGLSVNAGRSALLVQAQSTVLNVPALGKEVNKDPGCTCIRVAQGGQGLARSGLQTQSAGLTSRALQNAGCV